MADNTTGTTYGGMTFGTPPVSKDINTSSDPAFGPRASVSRSPSEILADQKAASESATRAKTNALMPKPPAASMFATTPTKPEFTAVPTAQTGAISVARTSKMTDEQIAWYESRSGIKIKNDNDLAAAEDIVMQNVMVNTAAANDINNVMQPVDPKDIPAKKDPTLTSSTVIAARAAEEANKKKLGCGVFPGCTLCSYLNYQVSTDGLLDFLDPSSFTDKIKGLMGQATDFLAENTIANTLKNLLKCTVYVSKSRAATLGLALYQSAKFGNVAMFTALADNLLPTNIKNFGETNNILAANMQQNIGKIRQLNTMLTGFGINPDNFFRIPLPFGISALNLASMWASSSNGNMLTDILLSPDMTGMASRVKQVIYNNNGPGSYGYGTRDPIVYGGSSDYAPIALGNKGASGYFGSLYGGFFNPSTPRRTASLGYGNAKPIGSPVRAG